MDRTQVAVDAVVASVAAVGVAVGVVLASAAVAAVGLLAGGWFPGGLAWTVTAAVPLAAGGVLGASRTDTPQSGLVTGAVGPGLGCAAVGLFAGAVALVVALGFTPAGADPGVDGAATAEWLLWWGGAGLLVGAVLGGIGAAAGLALARR